jgi:hypothetical protein
VRTPEHRLERAHLVAAVARRRQVLALDPHVTVEIEALDRRRPVAQAHPRHLAADLRQRTKQRDVVEARRQDFSGT